MYLSLSTYYVFTALTFFVKLAFHGADIDTDLLVDFRARIVHEPDTHEDPRRLVRHAARFSSRGCPLGMRACTRLQNYTIGASLGVSVRVVVGPMEFQLKAT